MNGNHSDEAVAAACEIAYERGRAEERERIRRLAIDHNALYLAHGDERQLTGMLPFADLLGGES